MTPSAWASCVKFESLRDHPELLIDAGVHPKGFQSAAARSSWATSKRTSRASVLLVSLPRPRRTARGRPLIGGPAGTTTTQPGGGPGILPCSSGVAVPSHLGQDRGGQYADRRRGFRRFLGAPRGMGIVVRPVRRRRRPVGRSSPPFDLVGCCSTRAGTATNLGAGPARHGLAQLVREIPLTRHQPAARTHPT